MASSKNAKGSDDANQDTDANQDDIGNKTEQGTRSFYRLLKRDVSWQSIKDVLTYEIPLPGTGARSEEELVKILVEQGWVNAEQLEDLRSNQDLVGESIGKVLVERGLVTQEQMDEAQSLRKETGQPLYRTLMQLKMAMPQDLMDALSSPIQLPFGNRPKDAFGNWLRDQNVMTDEELDAAWKEAQSAKEEFRKYLVTSEKITEEQYAQAVAGEQDLPYDDLNEVVSIPAKLVRMLPPFLLRRHRALPFKVVDNRLFVAFPDAHNVHDFEKMGLLLDMPVQPVLAPRARHATLLEQNVPLEDAELAVGKEEDAGRYDDGDRTMPAVELLTVILRGVIKSKGTDVHIEPQKDSARVRYRVDGMLHDVMTLDNSATTKVVSRVKSLSNMDIAQKHLPQDGHLVVNIGDRTRNFRISSIPTVYGEKVAMRLVQSDMAFSSFEQLGMTLAHRKLLNDILTMPSGLVVTTGPVGSGKTTTLYSCLNSMDCFSNNIVTIEDPVEYDIAGVNQMQVNTKRGLTFGVGLRAILRQDPNVVMVGEIRDEETAEIGVRAAMTGSLVLSTIHANSAATCISSFIQLGVRPYMVSLAVSGIIFQRLLRRVCPACKEPYEASRADKKELGIPEGQELTLYRGKGCAECLHTGYHGRTGCFEILKVNDAYRQAVVDNPTLANLKRAARDAEMIPLHAHGVELVTQGITTIEELARIL